VTTAARASDISVVMATYNRAQLVARALRSVSRQTDMPGEIVVVDDASTDGTPDVVRAWAKEASVPVRLLVAESNRGAGAARNSGIAAASGEFVAILDSDDEYLPHALASLSAPLREDRGAVVSFADAEVVFADGRPPHRHVAQHLSPEKGVSPTDVPGLYRLDDPQAHLLTTSFIPTCAALFRRDAALRVGCMPEARFGEDWLFWLRLTEQGDFLCRFEDVAIVHRQADNLTGGANDLANARRVLDALREVREGRHIALGAGQEQRLDAEIAKQEQAWRYFASRAGLAAYWDALGREGDRLAQLRRDPRSLLRAVAATLRRG
jgi:glycosyltransferase involved in cell wall biosynthesis